jgi:murein DD-endopeptidase MepM/ murein hydrolase activator NlpD
VFGRVVLGAVIVAGALALWHFRASPPPVAMLPAAVAPPPVRPTPEPPVAKPEPPAIGDLWLHPLAGPTRRMPERDSRLFGAERLHDSPSECRGGHCGIDLGGVYGEPVFAAHDGVVDRVQRALNPDHGGRYVRLAHQGGTVVTQYFHLSTIPRRLEEGAQVKAGDVVGFVGMTGIRHSAPHLHFTIEVRDPSGNDARYLDPEPLVALWPLRAPGGKDDGLRLASAPARLARGFFRRRHPHRAVAAGE